MSEYHGKNLGRRPKAKFNGKKVMSPTLAARELMRDAWPIQRYGKLDNVFYNAVRFISPRVNKDFTPRRARSIWEGSARRIDSEEMDALRAALIEEAHREQQELRARLAALDKKVAAFNESVAGRSVAQAGE